MDCRQPGLSVHGILQARILEWFAISSTRGIFLTQGSYLCLLHLLHCRWILYCWVSGEAQRIRDTPPFPSVASVHYPQLTKVNTFLGNLLNSIKCNTRAHSWLTALARHFFGFRTFPICRNTDEPRECHEWSKSRQRRRNIVWHLLYVECGKKWYRWTFLQNRKRLTNLENMVARERDS